MKLEKQQSKSQQMESQIPPLPPHTNSPPSSFCQLPIQPVGAGGLWGDYPAPQLTVAKEACWTRQTFSITQCAVPLLPPRVPRRDTKAILSVLISSALHVFGKLRQLCGRLAEFQEVDVFLGLDSSLFALDEVATQENLSPSPWAGRLQDSSMPWDMAQGLSPDGRAFTSLRLLIGLRLAHILLCEETLWDMVQESLGVWEHVPQSQGLQSPSLKAPC